MRSLEKIRIDTGDGMNAGDEKISDDIRTERKKIRRLALQLRNGLSKQACEEKSRCIMETLKQQTEYKNASLLFLYASYQNEVMTHALIEDTLFIGKRVALPVSTIVEEIPRLDFYEITDMAQIVSGYKGIPEPDITNSCVKQTLIQEVPDLLLMPGVAFDRTRNRLGYGMGFYDRFLQRRFRIQTIAVAYECQLFSEIPATALDYRPDKLITEERIY